MGGRPPGSVAKNGIRNGDTAVTMSATTAWVGANECNPANAIPRAKQAKRLLGYQGALIAGGN